jgi:hypothetical protein
VESKADWQKERNATDWTQRSPGGELSPLDDRALTATIAGFPYGEPLHVAAIASVKPNTQPAPGTPLAAPTKSKHSVGR